MTTRDTATGEPRRRKYRFGDFVLDLDAGFLRRNGQEVPLRPKAFEVLAYLVVCHGRLVPKDELVEAVWPDAAVTDNSISQCLSEIRRASGDESQRVIRTVPRRGYALNLPVSMVFGDAHQSGGEVMPPPMIAVEALSDPERNATASTPRPATSPAVARRRVLAAGLIVLAGVMGVGALLMLRSSRPLAPGPASPEPLTNFNDSAVSPALSHDGRVLTFVRGGSFGTTAAPNGQIYVKVLPDGEPVQLTHDGVTKDHPVFSPDDSRIVYTVLRPGLSWDSWQVPVLGGAPQPFLPNASAVNWLEKERLVYATIKSGIHMGIASSTESRSQYKEIYLPGQDDGMAHRATPSPDGKSLLVVEMTGGTWLPCRLVPVDGSSTGRVVGPTDGQCTRAAWSPDGRWIYLSSNTGGAYHIWRQRYPDGAPEQITFGPTEQEGIAISPDGGHLITSMGFQQASIWLHDANGDRKLTDSGYAVQPTMTSSGNRLYYLVRTPSSRGQASGELWALDLSAGTKQRVLPAFVMSNYSLSLDGHTVVFTTSANDASDGIWIADMDLRSPPHQLVRGHELRAFVGAAGEIIYRGEDSRLYRIADNGSGREPISTEPVAYLSTVSPDGRWAVVILPQAADGVGTTSLALMSLISGKSFQVCNDACSVGPRSFLIAPAFAWSRDGKRLFVNLVHFGRSTPRTVVLPYDSTTPPEKLWPRGLRLEQDVLANPDARVIDAPFTFPTERADSYLFLRTFTVSNLYRLPLPN